MSALLALSLWLCVSPLPREVVVKQGESLTQVAQRALGDAKAASELKALNGLAHDSPAPGTTLKLPGAERALAVTALAAAKNAIEQSGTSVDKRSEATAKLAEAEALLATAKYTQAAKAADEAWRLVSEGAREPTRFAVTVEEGGHTQVKARSGLPIHVEAEGTVRPVYPGQKLEVGKKPQPPPPAPSSRQPRPPPPAPPPPPPPVGLQAPLPLTPTEASKFTQGQQKAEVVLSWKPVGGAQAYEVELTGARTLSLKVPKAEARLPALPKGTYRWTVRARSEAGTPSEFSAARTFEVVEAPLQLEVKPSTWK